MSRKILVYFLLFQTGCQFVLAQNNNTSEQYQTSEVHQVMVLYNSDLRYINSFYGQNFQFDGRYFEMGIDNLYLNPEYRDRLIRVNTEYLKQLDEMNFNKLNVVAKVDYTLFKRNLESSKNELVINGKNAALVASYFPFCEKIYAIEKLRRRGYSVNGKNIAKELDDVRKSIIDNIERLKSVCELEPNLAQLAASQATGLREILKNIYEFYNGYDPMFTWWVPEIYKIVDSLLEKYAGEFYNKVVDKTIQKDSATGISGKPIERKELLYHLEMEYIPYSPEELLDIANKQLAFYDEELKKESRKMGFGDNWMSAYDKVKNGHVQPGNQPETLYGIYKKSLEFLKSKDLITIPSLAEETWGMDMIDPEGQTLSPFFTGGQTISIAYPTNTMSYEDKIMRMRGNNPSFSYGAVPHEIIPGHHLQGFMLGRYRPYRNFHTSFWTEGGAFYWELLLYRLNYPQTPEEKLGMLFWIRHRCARIIFTLNFHLGKWTINECIDYLVKQIGHERSNAEGEVRRSFMGPALGQLAYMIGGLQFYALKNELVDSHKMTYRQFHDAVLKEHSIPVELLRATLISQPLKKDFKSCWRFYECLKSK